MCPEQSLCIYCTEFNVLFNYGPSRMSCYLCLCSKVNCIVCSLRGVSLEVLGQLFKNDTCNICFTVEIHPCETRVFWFHFRKKQRKWKEKKCILFVQRVFQRMDEWLSCSHFWKFALMLENVCWWWAMLKCTCRITNLGMKPSVLWNCLDFIFTQSIHVFSGLFRWWGSYVNISW